MPERPGDMDERDVDARFASIIARWDGPVPADDTPGTASDDVTSPDAVAAPADAETPPDAAATPDPATTADAATTEHTAEPATDAGPGATDVTDVTDAAEPPPPASPRSPWVNPSPLDLVVPASAWRAAEPSEPGTEAGTSAAALEEEHFEPPEVVLPPQEDLHFWGAVIGLVAGPLMLLYVVFARPFHSTRWFVAAVVVSLVGFALLVLRQPRHRDPTSGDDGARV